MSSDKKQDVVTKTVEDERIHLGVLRPSVDEAEEVESPDEDEEDTDESEKSDDADKSGSTGLNSTIDICYFTVLAD